MDAECEYDVVLEEIGSASDLEEITDTRGIAVKQMALTATKTMTLKAITKSEIVMTVRKKLK